MVRAFIPPDRVLVRTPWLAVSIVAVSVVAASWSKSLTGNGVSLFLQVGEAIAVAGKRVVLDVVFDRELVEQVNVAPPAPTAAASKGMPATGNDFGIAGVDVHVARWQAG